MPSTSKKGKPVAHHPPPKKGTGTKAPPPARKGAATPRPAGKAAPKPPSKVPPKAVAKPTTPAKGGPARPSPSKSSASAAGVPPLPELPISRDSRRHVLSLSFLRDGDEFLARLETDAGQITELKNRSLDQLLTLVAGELEDILE